MVPNEPDAQIVPISKTTSPPMIPDMAAMITAMIDVTKAMPPRVRESQTFSDEYISRAMPDLSSNAAIKMKSGIEIRT